MAIGAIVISVIGSQICRVMGRPQIDSAIRVIGAISGVSPNSKMITGIADRMAAGLLLIYIRGIGGIIHRRMFADG